MTLRQDRHEFVADVATEEVAENDRYWSSLPLDKQLELESKFQDDILECDFPETEDLEEAAEQERREERLYNERASIPQIHA